MGEGARRAEGRHSVRLRARHPHSRPAGPGTHAAGGRGRWLMPVVAAGVALLGILVWQALGLLAGGSPSPRPAPAAADATGPSGSTTTVAIGDTGSMHVTETLTFATPLSRLDLSLPKRQGVGTEFAPRISALQVRAGTAPEPGSAVDRMDSDGAASISFRSPSSRIQLEYDVSGAVVRSDTSNPERALALVTPLVVEQSRRLPARVDVATVKVLNVGCLHGKDLTGCGTKTSGGWTVETSGDTLTDVVAQLNLAVP